MKGVGRRTQLLDDLRNRRHCEIKEEPEDPKRWKRQFITGIYGRNISYLPKVHGHANKYYT